MAIKDEKLVAKINSEEKAAITEAAEQLDIPVSQFVREAVREKLTAISDAATDKTDPATA